MRCILLKENDPAIREKIREAGIKVCLCAGFDDSIWLDYHPGNTDSVHGVGYPFEFEDSQDNALKRFLAENIDKYVCKDVDEFIAKIKESGK